MADGPAHATCPSLDHAVCTQKDGLRNRNAERTRGLQIHDQLEPGRLQNGQVARLRGSHNASTYSATAGHMLTEL